MLNFLKRVVLTLVIAGAFVAGMIVALAVEVRGDTTEVRLLKYLDWITANSEFEHDGASVPRIRFTTVSEMRRLSGAIDPHAIYTHWNDTIWFEHGEDPFSIENRHAVVHELVHFLQDRRGDFEGQFCAGDFELPAYEIQVKWQNAHDDPNPRPDRFTLISIKAACRMY